MSNLKVLRELNNLTQEHVAYTIGVDQSTYSKIERNPKIIKAEQAEKLAELYGVGIGDILSQGVSISFTNNTIDKGYIHNHYDQNSTIDKIIDAKDGEILVLKEQVEYLRKQNEQLLQLVGKK